MVVDKHFPDSAQPLIQPVYANTVDRSQQTDLVGCDVSSDQVAIYGSTTTLEVMCIFFISYSFFS